MSKNRAHQNAKPSNDDAPENVAEATEAKPVIKVSEALSVRQACEMLLSVGIEADKRFTWALMRNRNMLKSVAEDHEEERQKLLKKYAKTDPKTGEIVPDENNQAQFEKGGAEKFQKEFAELLDLDAGVEFYKVDFALVPNNIATGALAQLEPILKNTPDDA